MSYSFEYDPCNYQELKIKFDCNNCGGVVISREIPIPYPNINAEKDSDSQRDLFDTIYCKNCNKEYVISLHSSFGSGIGYIENLDEKDEVIVVEVETNPFIWDDSEFYDSQYEAIFENTEFYSNFLKELDDIESLSRVQIAENLQNIHYRHLYSSIIGNMETYLSDAFINTVLSKDDLVEIFFETFNDFKNTSIKLSKLPTQAKEINNIAKKSMLDVVYHNIAKVSNMYKKTLNITFPEFEEIGKAVDLRHHVVHRNGKDKNGKEIIITKETLDKLIINVKEWIASIDQLLKEKHYNLQTY